MDQPDGSKQADREAEGVFDEDRAAFDEWQRERTKTESASTVATVAIPDSVVELDADNDAMDSRNGKLVERDEDGAWQYLPAWPFRSFEYRDQVWEYREPKPIAAIFFATASDPNSKPMEKLRAIMNFLEHTLSAKSLKVMHRRGFDHEDDFDQADMSEIVRTIAEGETSRPTMRS